jgi:hypothetical protein
VSPAFRADPEGELRRALWTEEKSSTTAPEPTPVKHAAVVAKDERPPDIAQTYCRVKSTPAGAPVFLDGKDTGQVTPAKLTIFAGRDNQVSVRMKGYVPVSEIISPNLNQNTERDYALVAGTPMAVRSVPQGAEVLVDGTQVLAATPGEVEGVAFGPHQIIVRKKGMADVVTDVVAKEGKPLSLDVNLFTEAKVRVKSLPPHAEIVMDGRPTGQFTPADLVVSSEEKHLVELRHPKYLSATQELAPVPANELEEVMIPLELTTVSTLKARISQLEEALAEKSADRAKAAGRLAQAKKKQKPEAETLEDELALKERAVASTKSELDQLKAELETMKKKN